MNTLGYAGPPLNSSTRLSWYPGKPSSCLGRFSPLGHCFFGSVWTLCVAGCLERRVFSFVCVGERSQLCDRFYTRLGFSWQVYSQAIKHSRRSHRTDPGYDRIKRKPERDLASKKLPFFRKLWWPERVRVSWSTKLLQAPFMFKSCSRTPHGLFIHPPQGVFSCTNICHRRCRQVRKDNGGDHQRRDNPRPRRLT